MPIRPKNINAINTILAGTVKPAVIPVDKPHVPNAEVTSNTMENNVFSCSQ